MDTASRLAICRPQYPLRGEILAKISVAFPSGERKKRKIGRFNSVSKIGGKFVGGLLRLGQPLNCYSNAIGTFFVAQVIWISISAQPLGDLQPRQLLLSELNRLRQNTGDFCLARATPKGLPQPINLGVQLTYSVRMLVGNAGRKHRRYTQAAI
jgi:hypothetical protein